jgi:ankyrin repeat protein
MPASPEWIELRALVAGKRFDEAATLLARKPSLRTAVNGLGETVLHYQAVEDDQEGVSWLASQGFDIDTRNQFGTPVAFEVAQLDYRDLLRWFISSGADLKCLDGEGKNIKEYVLEFGHEDIANHLESMGI